MHDRALPLDRIAPTRRPPGPSAGTQRWRELLFLHWSVPIDAVRPLVPAALELDPWDGRMWVGAVPFCMEAVRTSWMPRGTGLEFLELNLRTYVHHRGEPGVWFFSLEAASWLAVRAARATWSLPYWHADMQTERAGDRISYRSARRDPRATLDTEYTIGPRLGPSTPGTLEHFVLERYHLFAHRRGRILRGTVHHPPYDAHVAHVAELSQTLTRAAGLPPLDTPPELTHFAPGVDVEVFGPTVFPA
jgi:uncharacterized protein YqjF (DUF2071 family)